MPPRDTALFTLNDAVDSDNGTDITAAKEPEESLRSTQQAATASSTFTSNNGTKKPHNTPTNVGFRRNTFHWELNVWTFGFLALVYYYVIPTSARIVMQVLFALIAMDAARYYYAKGNMPGVPYTLPFVNLIAMVICPVRFWAEMGCIAMESGQGICTNVMASHFMIFITDTTLCRQVMTGEGTYGIYAHPNALWLFGPRNLIYMDTEPHKHFRAILTPALFSKEALMEYAQAQEIVCRRFMKQYAASCANDKRPIDVRVAFRAMAAASSQEAFLGPYLTDALRAQLEADIVTFTMGFLSFPFPYFNSGLHIAIQAKDRIEAIIEHMVPQARAWIQSGQAPRCLLERWCLAIRDDAAARGLDVTSTNAVPFCADDDMARTVLDFLFAAQDATNSALAFSLDVLGEDRAVLQKMRDEIDAECAKTGTHDIWTKMRSSASAATSTSGATDGGAGGGDSENDAPSIAYTAKVANQLLHHKPPVPMIPHRAKKDAIFAGRAIAKGTICIPSITYSARTSGASLDFRPERSDPDSLFVKTVVFGAGQHKCPGRRYAESLLTIFLGVLAQDFDFERTGPRPYFDEFVYYPTTFPKDCDFIIKERTKE